MIRVVSELRKCRGTRKKCRETRDDDDMSNKVEYWLMVSVLFAMNISKNLDRVDECSSVGGYAGSECRRVWLCDRRSHLVLV